MQPEFTITGLTAKDVNVILAGMKELQGKLMLETYGKIGAQIDAQNRAMDENKENKEG